MQPHPIDTGNATTVQPQETKGKQKEPVVEIDLVVKGDPDYEPLCCLADETYINKIGFATLTHPDWALALYGNGSLIGSASAIFGNEHKELSVMQFGADAKEQMDWYLAESGVHTSDQYAEITCFNVLGQWQKYKQALLAYMFWYLHTIGTKATLNIQPILLKRTASTIGANAKTFCKATVKHYVADDDTKKRIHDGYITPLRPVCVGVQPATVVKKLIEQPELTMGVTPRATLRAALASEEHIQNIA